jgi:hypothetical protein
LPPVPAQQSDAIERKDDRLSRTAQAAPGRLAPVSIRRGLIAAVRLAQLVWRLRKYPVTVRSLLLMLDAGTAANNLRSCPICGFVGRFDLTTYGNPPRWDSRCPSCVSAERNRLLMLAVDSLRIVPASRILHFAPEACLKRRLRQEFTDYRSASLGKQQTDLRLNIETIALEAGSVDVVLCSHVLEHVNDRKALPELFRILSPGGLLLLMVPIIEGWRETYEDSSIVDAKERLEHFGRVDHLRIYGADIRERIRKAGFDLAEYTAGGKDAIVYGLCRGEKVFICRKVAVEHR